MASPVRPWHETGQGDFFSERKAFDRVRVITVIYDSYVSSHRIAAMSITDDHLPAGASPGARAFIGLGSNLGDAAANLDAARSALSRLPEVDILRFSPVYRTEPQGMREQPFFFNQVAEVRCSPALRPQALLETLQAVESALGRDRKGAVRFGPRVIDLDLLLFGNTRINNPRLTLPHPRMVERAFVLLPLADLVPELILPQGISVRGALSALKYTLQGDAIFQGSTE